MGADTDPSAFTRRIEPPFSVTRNVPSGRKAIDHGAFRRSVNICVSNGADGGGAGASVCPGNAGFGLGDCWAKRERHVTAIRPADKTLNFFMTFLSVLEELFIFQADFIDQLCVHNDAIL